MIKALRLPSAAARSQLSEYPWGGCPGVASIIRGVATTSVREQTSLVISGPSGTGKSLLLWGLAIFLTYEHNLKGVYHSAPDYSQGRYERAKSGANLPTESISGRVLYLDNMGRGNPSQYEKRDINGLILEAWERDMSVVLSTSLSPSALPQYLSEEVLRRISAGASVTLGGRA